MWHPQSGLVVSPFSRTLPSSVVSSPESNRPDDFSKPRLLKDDNIFLAFYPRQPIHRGPLFSVLAVSPDDLSNSIHTTATRNGEPMFILDSAIRSRWKNLETSLLEVVHTLYSAHPQNRLFPILSYPRWPFEYGYNEAHKTRELTLHCAKKSLTAFTLLAAFTTFVLSLWLAENEDDCLDAAFTLLTERKADALPRVWLQYLRDSVICNFSPGLRPGGFLNPSVTFWGQFLGQFTRASVPFWLLWGQVQSPENVADLGIHYYFPPRKYIELAQKRVITFSNTILPYEFTYTATVGDDIPAFGPTIHFPDLPTSDVVHDDGHGLENFTIDNHDAFVSNANPDEPPSAAPNVDRTAGVEAGSGQKAGETWEEFHWRMSDQLLRRKQHEDAKAKQRRENLEKAAQNGPSSTCVTFLWEEDPVVTNFYRRTRVTKAVAPHEFRLYTPYQRFFWSHKNEWDLCPHLPAYPDGQAPVNVDDSDDDSDDEDYPKYTPTSRSQLVKPTQEPVGPVMLQAVRDITMRNPEPEDATFDFVFLKLPQYLRQRHGFTAVEEESWNPQLHVQGKLRLDKTRWDLAVKTLLHEQHEATDSLAARTSIVDFYNTALREETTYVDLPCAWDISRVANLSLFCDMQLINLQCVSNAIDEKKKLYILRPPKGSRDPSSWFVATTSATAVLLVYRSEWKTMFEIGRGLLELGIPFRTVVEWKRDRQPVKKALRSKTKGLGSRPHGFSPTREDLIAYQSARDDILRSGYGRSIRLLGGIMGRLAAEVVPDYDILDGPNLVDVEVVGRDGNSEFVDDAVGDEQLDIVSGVYFVKSTSISHNMQQSHLSWFPKHGTWLASGLAGDQWLPFAEEWYQSRLSAFNTGTFKLETGTYWKSSLRRRRVSTEAIREASERLAAGFISSSSRVF
jgi:hypothetical protein